MPLQATGIETKTVYAAKGLAQRPQAEGAASPADVILTVDIARLAEYAALDFWHQWNQLFLLLISQRFARI